MHLYSILSNNSIMKHLPETPKRKKRSNSGINSFKYNLRYNFSYQNTVNDVNIRDSSTFGTSINSC